MLHCQDLKARAVLIMLQLCINTVKGFFPDLSTFYLNLSQNKLFIFLPMLKVQFSSNNLSWDNFSLSFDAITPFLFSLLVFFLQLIGIEVKTHNNSVSWRRRKNILIAVHNNWWATLWKTQQRSNPEIRIMRKKQKLAISKRFWGKFLPFTTRKPYKVCFVSLKC